MFCSLLELGRVEDTNSVHPHISELGFYVLVPLNDNLNSFSPTPAPSFGQMLRHLSEGLKCGAGEENFTISSTIKIRIQIQIRPIFCQQNLIRFQKLLLQFNYAKSALKRHIVKFICACPLIFSFCKLPKIFSQ